MAYIGIDLGTTYCAAARFTEGQPQMVSFGGGSNIMPSVVSVGKTGKILVGWDAKRNQASNPHDTILEVKRSMGEDIKIKLGQKEYTPIEISAMILTEVKKMAEAYLDEPVDGAVITCPAYFDNKQREATKEAGRLAGLEVIQVLNEPTAAAHAYGALGTAEEEGLFLVYDLGGGTFDVTVIEKSGGLLEVIGTGGDPNLGGGNFDDEIVEWMLEHLKQADAVKTYLEDASVLSAIKIKLKAEAEKAKIRLCGPPSVENTQFNIINIISIDGRPVHFQETLTMLQFQEMVRKLIKEKSLPWVEVALENPKEILKYTEEDLTAVLLVGGSTRIPMVREILQERFPNTPIRGIEVGIDPDVIVAAGASMLAAEKDPKSTEKVKTDIIDVTGHSLSVASLDPRNKALVLTTIIEKETQIPVSRGYKFSTVSPGQREIQIQVYQGEHGENEPVEKAMQDKNRRVIRIGEFTMEIDDPQPDLIPIEIGLSLDQNGILVATAKNLTNGKEIKCEISNVDRISMKASELKQKQAQLAEDLAGRIGSSANPLEMPSEPIPAGTSSAGQPPAHGTAMNPVIRNLYERLLNNFSKIPEKDRLNAMQMLMNIEQDAKSGDQAKLMGYYEPLSKLLKEIE